MIQEQSVLWIEFFGCQTNNHNLIYNFQMIFLSFKDKTTDIITPYLFLKYLFYNNNFTCLFFPLLLFFFFSLRTIFKPWKVSLLSGKATAVVLDVYVFFDFP